VPSARVTQFRDSSCYRSRSAFPPYDYLFNMNGIRPPAFGCGRNQPVWALASGIFLSFIPSLSLSSLYVCTNRFPLALRQALERELVKSSGPGKRKDPAIVKVYRYGPRDLGYRVNFSISRRQTDGCETLVSNYRHLCRSTRLYTLRMTIKIKLNESLIRIDVSQKLGLN